VLLRTLRVLSRTLRMTSKTLRMTFKTLRMTLKTLRAAKVTPRVRKYGTGSRGRGFELKNDTRLAEPRNVPHRVVHIDRKEAGESESESE
jgi:hypothetical protein